MKNVNFNNLKAIISERKKYVASLGNDVIQVTRTITVNGFQSSDSRTDKISSYLESEGSNLSHIIQTQISNSLQI